MLTRFLNDETGAVVSAELILIVTIIFCGVAVGMSTVASAVATELNDVAEMIGSVDQSYAVSGHTAPTGTGGTQPNHASCQGFGFTDGSDECDCEAVILTLGGIKTQADIGDGTDG